MLTINVSLEASKHKQAKEIRDLRRRLRESRLVLPPRAFRSLRASDGPEVEEEESEDEDEEEEGDSELGNGAGMGKADETFLRVRGLLESLLESGRRALESKTEDFVEKKGGTRVLHEIEARPWRDRKFSQEHDMHVSSDPDAHATDVLDDGSLTTNDESYLVNSLPPSRPSSRGPLETIQNSSFQSEDEVEALVSMMGASMSALSIAHSSSPATVGIAI